MTQSRKKSAMPSNLPGLFRPKDLENLGIRRERLRLLLRASEVERVARGVYRVVENPATEYETIALVCKRIPQAIVCLLTALHVHGIGTQAPREVWIGLHRKGRKPATGEFPVRLVRFSGPMLRYGIQTREIQGVSVRITSPARTVVDCFRYRNKLGLDVATEALRDTIRSRKATVDEIVRAAEVCRARTVIRPYLEAMES